MVSHLTMLTLAHMLHHCDAIYREVLTGAEQNCDLLSDIPLFFTSHKVQILGKAAMNHYVGFMDSSSEVGTLYQLHHRLSDTEISPEKLHYGHRDSS